MTILITILLVLNILILVLIFRSAASGKGFFNPSQKSTPDSAVASEAHIEPEIQEILSDIMGKIDQKIEILKVLLNEADQKINGLRNISTAVSPRRDTEGERAKYSSIFTGTPSRPMSQLDKVNQVVYLSRRGMDSSAIAQETGLGAGEVEFILNIEKATQRQRL
ncbi:MAG: hypothetical protein AB1546_10145 [bacterium]